MIPSVTVNITENRILNSSQDLTLLPGVVIKTKSGPINQLTTVHNLSEFLDIFGSVDYTVPSAYSISKYLTRYAPLLVCRVADANAAQGTVTVTNTIEGDPDPIIISLFKVDTDYKTEDLNNVNVTLKIDSDLKVIWFEATLYDIKYTSSKVFYDSATATAVDLESALDHITTAFNATQKYVTITNLYTDKVEADPLPVGTSFVGTIVNGDSGNTAVTEPQFVESAKLFAEPAYNVDILVVPEATSTSSINQITKIAESIDAIFITSPTIEILSVDTPEILADKAVTAVSGYAASNSLAVYYPDVYYLDLTHDGEYVRVPASVAVLEAYARTDSVAKWYAPAGTNRGTLSLVGGLCCKVTEPIIEKLYDNAVPINCVREFKDTGYVIWGNKTTDVEAPYMDRINISRLVKYLTKQIYTISYDYLFEQIAQSLYNEWTMRVSSLLEEVKNGNGVEKYIVQMDDTLNTEETKAKNQLIGQVSIMPIEATEYIIINFAITNQI